MLGGCFMGSSEHERAAVAAGDDQTWQGYGARPGTDIYVQCRTAQQKARNDRVNAIIASPDH
jgi:hypothetical protein